MEGNVLLLSGDCFSRTELLPPSVTCPDAVSLALVSLKKCTNAPGERAGWVSAEMHSLLFLDLGFSLGYALKVALTVQRTKHQEMQVIYLDK